MRQLAVLFLVLTLVLGGCGRPPAPPPPATEPPPTAGEPPAPPTPSLAEVVEGWLADLTLEEKIGQMLWVGLAGPELDAQAEALLAAGKAGGVILFARNGTDPLAVRGLTDQLQATVAKRDRATPALVVMVDQEGGLVQRYRAPLTDWPGNMALGAAADRDLAYQMAAATAAELRSLGIHMNLAPVADVNNNPNNPVIGLRSFGEDVRAVSALVAATVRGYQDHGVMAVVKHFPGHGDTEVDSHHALPVIDHTLERLEAVELPPFAAAMEAGVSAVMAAHINFPALAPDSKPATLSPAVLTGLLRERLTYQGVVVTDAMEMAALAGTTGVAEGLVEAVLAGADALLVAESFAEQAAFHAALVSAVQQGRIPEARIEAAVRRLLLLKGEAGLLPDRSGAPAAVALPPATGGPWAEHRTLAQRIADQAVTLVRDDAGLVPVRLGAGAHLVVISPGPAAPDGLTALGRSIKEQHARMTEVVVDRRTPTDAERAEVSRQIGAADLVLYALPYASAGQRALLAEVTGTGKPLIVVGLGEPYDLLQLPNVATFVVTYGDSEAQMRAVAAPLFGGRPFTGTLPVSIPPLYPMGHGLTGAPS